MQANGIVTLTTDFGKEGSYAGAVKGVLFKINPRIKVVDITNEVSGFNILEGAIVLNSFYQFFPKGTIHLVVVDPGVGGKRKGILIRTDDYFFVGPDNGIFSFIYEKERIREMISLTNSKYFLAEPSSTFHGRDIFAPVSAYLSLGIRPQEFGTLTKDCYKLRFPQPALKDGRLTGEIIYIDRFGNLVSNINADLLGGKREVRVRIGNRKIDHLSRYYEEEKVDKLMMLIGSSNSLEIAVNQGNAQKVLKAKLGDRITVEKIKE